MVLDDRRRPFIFERRLSLNRSSQLEREGFAGLRLERPSVKISDDLHRLSCQLSWYSPGIRASESSTILEGTLTHNFAVFIDGLEGRRWRLSVVSGDIGVSLSTLA